MRSRRAPSWPRRTSPAPVLELPGRSLARDSQPALAQLDGHYALQYQSVLSPDECAALVRGIYAGRGAWTENFAGIQYTLGRAYYVELEQEREADYFAQAVASDSTVERWAPGLQARLAAIMAMLVGGPVTPRPEFCGAGVHIFPAGGLCSLAGGDIHYDLEGLSEAQVEAEAPALTCVLMLQPPERGGGLRVWDSLYTGVDFAPGMAPPLGSAVCQYGVGDLVVIDSRRLHQIMPFGGAADRISATLHAVYDGEAETWEVWF